MGISDSFIGKHDVIIRLIEEKELEGVIRKIVEIIDRELEVASDLPVLFPVSLLGNYEKGFIFRVIKYNYEVFGNWKVSIQPDSVTCVDQPQFIVFE